VPASDEYGMRRLATLTALVCVAALSMIPPATALQACGDRTDLETEITQADVVFMGRVESTSDAGRTAEMAVMAVWKGDDLPPHVTVNGNTGATAANARTFQQGGIYLIFPANDRPPFADDACTATRIYRPNGLVIPPDLVGAVGSASARAPVAESAEEETDGGGVPVGLGIMFVALGAIILAAFTFPKIAGNSSKRTGTGTLGELSGPGAPGQSEEDKKIRDASAKRFKRARRRSGRW